jgi:hypothetical protein
MIRSILVPGLGQMSVGSYVRGGIFIAVRSTSYFMLFRTMSRLGESRDLERTLTRMATDSLDALIASDTVAARRLSDPDLYAAAVTDYPGVIRARKYVNSRRQQRQDWITYLLFFTLMDAVDAYVNAHLKGFPTSISSEVNRDGSVNVGASLPLPSWMGGTRAAPANVASPGSHPRRW